MIKFCFSIIHFKNLCVPYLKIGVKSSLNRLPWSSYHSVYCWRPTFRISLKRKSKVNFSRVKYEANQKSHLYAEVRIGIFRTLFGPSQNDVKSLIFRWKRIREDSGISSEFSDGPNISRNVPIHISICKSLYLWPGMFHPPYWFQWWWESIYCS